MAVTRSQSEQKLMELQSPKVKDSRGRLLKETGTRWGLDNDLSLSEKSIL